MIKNVLTLIMLLVILAFLIENCTSYQPIHNPKDQSDTALRTTPLRQHIQSDAYQYIGAKYKYAGNNPKGFDCSGFTSFIMSKNGISLSRSSTYQAREGRKIAVSAAMPGDLVFFSKTPNGKVSHVALVVANDRRGLKVVHSTTSRGVIAENISQSIYWKPKILFARDVIGK